MHKYNDVIMNIGNGRRRQIVRGNPAMPIKYIEDNKLIDCTLLALDIDYNIGLFYN